MSARFATGRLLSLTHTLRPWCMLHRVSASSYAKKGLFSVKPCQTSTYLSSYSERCGSLVKKARQLSSGSQSSKCKESQSYDEEPSDERHNETSKGGFSTRKQFSKWNQAKKWSHATKWKHDVIREKKTLRRALTRFNSRLALFRLQATHTTKRKIASSLGLIRRYMKEKRLKFGAIGINQKRLERMREIKKKMAKKSQQFQIGIKYMLNKFGKLGVGIYFGVYIITLALMNMLTFNGYVTANDLRRILKKLHLDHFNIPDIDSAFARFTVAYIATKALEPLRFVVSLLLIMVANKLLKR